MKGDFTRFTHDPKKHYSGVLKQQGRVDLDADWNEYVQIEDYLKQTGTKDIIGQCGVPESTRNGFLIGRTDGHSSLVLKSGDVKPARIYVDGIMCEMEKDVIPLNPGDDGTYLAYLDVWQRHITAVEDSSIAEVALGGPDTTTRIKTEWQVRLHKLSLKDKSEKIDFKQFCRGDSDWKPMEYASTGKMASHAKKSDVKEGLCKVGDMAGYRGLENRLYRVEIHDGGKIGTDKVTFKWSRDNGSVVFPIQKIEYTSGKSTVTLKQTGKDDVLTLHVGDWVEVTNDRDELALETGTIAQVADGSDVAKGLIVLETDVSAYQTNHPKIRRWDQKDNSQVTLVSGTIQIKTETWMPLEDGVEVNFNAGTYQTGDYWLIPARTKLRDVIWKVIENTPVFQPRHGIEHHYCALALARFTDGTWSEPIDFRSVFPSLNELRKSCCIPVHPGENLQQIIDCVIASGGGCICLCDGVHRVKGPLHLNKANNLTICGEKTATVVHFYGTNEKGEGGFILTGCMNVTITDMLIVGDDVPSLLSINTESRINLNITLDNLTLFNRTLSKEETTSKCAIRLGNASDIKIERCRMIAENGIISLFGDSLPDPALLDNTGDIRDNVTYVEAEPATNAEKDETGNVSYNRTRSDNRPARPATPAAEDDTSKIELNYGIGVHKLRMNDTTIFFRNYGIWTLKSIGWNLQGCRITHWPGFKNEVRKWPDDMASEEPYQTILGYIEKAELFESTLTSGTAIKALSWKDCNTKGCALGGDIGMNISIWSGGETADNMIRARYGLVALWLHDAAWRGNDVKCNSIGMVISGSYRSRIEGNQVHSGIGLENVPAMKWIHDIDQYSSEIVSAYNVAEDAASAIGTHATVKPYDLMALWILLEEACNGLRLDGLRDACQELLDTVENYKGIPVLLLAAVYLKPRINQIAKFSSRIPMPLIALKVKGNEIEAKEAGIRLTDFIPMGGMNIADNRVQTLKGQAIEIKANQYTVNPYAVIVVWRYAVKMLPAVVKKLAATMAESDLIKELSPERKKAVIKILACLEDIFAGLNSIIEPIMEADYRVENNSIRSRRTAIEANLFELAIQNNHITMEESEYSNKETDEMIGVLEKYDTTKNIATGMRQRSKARMQIYMKKEDTSGAAETTQTDLAEAATEIGKTTSNPELQSESDNLVQAVKEADDDKTRETLEKVVEILGSYVDTCGIWIKGAGCRVVGNQVVVPPDADPKSWALGGIRFWDDEGSPIWLLVFIEELLQLYKPEMDIPSLVAATETLIDNNEIIRGIGYGIEINGITNMPMGMGLVDLKIRGNQIRDMAGAGIAFDEKSMTIGADIEDNRILDCGSLDSTASLVDKKGGIVVRNSALCRIHNNRIRCSSNLENKVGMFAVDLQAIYGLTMTDNHIQHGEISGYRFEAARETIGALTSNVNLMHLALANLCGAIKISEIHGEAAIQNNDILLSRGIGTGLLLGNLATVDTDEFWHLMLRKTENYTVSKARRTYMDNAGDKPVTANTDTFDLVTTTSVQINHFESLMNKQFFAFLIAGLTELNFSGNNVRTKVATRSPGYILSINRGLINNNMLDTLAISMGDGVVAGNVSNEVINIPSGVVNGLNTPT